jgi:multimeric flavodoxin WrbA
MKRTQSIESGENSMAAKQVLVVKGSPRPQGNSSILADQAADGARYSGAQVEVFNLQDMDIRPCDACDMCHEQNGICVIKDDMQSLYPRLRQADAILIASPIYWFTINAQTKLFIDRWYALEGPQGNALKGKQFGVLLAFGDTDSYTSGAINAIRTFQDMFRYLRADLVGIVYGAALDEGDAKKQPALLERAFELGKKIGANA